MKRARCLLIPVALTAVIVASGCYTKVIPPSDEGYVRAGRHSDCADCHGKYQQYSGDYFSAPYPEYWRDHYDYASYYVYPWWRSDNECAYLCEDHDNSLASSRDSKFDHREIEDEPGSPYDNDEYYDPYPADVIIVPPLPYYPSTGGYGSTQSSRPGSDDNSTRTRDTDSGSSGQKETRRTPQGDTVAQNGNNSQAENGGQTGGESNGDQNMKRSRGKGGGR